MDTIQFVKFYVNKVAAAERAALNAIHKHAGQGLRPWTEPFPCDTCACVMPTCLDCKAPDEWDRRQEGKHAED